MKLNKEMILIVLLLLAIVFCLGLAPMLFYLSGVYAAQSPELVRLRVPMLILSFGILALTVLVLLLAVRLVWQSKVQSIFVHATVKTLRWMGHILLASAAFFIVMSLYPFVVLGTKLGLVGNYLVIAAFLYVLVATLIYFMADLFYKAVLFKEENELTV